MIGGDPHGVKLLQVFKRRVGHLQLVLAAMSNVFKEWIVIADLRAFFLQQLDDSQCRGLAQIVDVFLIGTPSTSTFDPFRLLQCRFNACTVEATT